MLRLTFSLFLLSVSVSAIEESTIVNHFVPVSFGGSKVYKDLDFSNIEAKLDRLEFRFMDLYLDLKEQSDDVIKSQRRFETIQQLLNQQVAAQERKIVSLAEDSSETLSKQLSMIHQEIGKSIELQSTCTSRESIRQRLFDARPSGVSTANWAPPCSTASPKTSGLCRMKLEQEDVVVYYEQHRFGGEWLIFMQRFDGSINFHRNWTDYRNGFGTVGQEFWFGLEKLHQLTSRRVYELLVEMEDYEGNYRYARYNGFFVGGEEDDYSFSLTGYTGTAGDSFMAHNGAKFSTFDRGAEKNCSSTNTGGWWYRGKTCYESHLTGRWGNYKSSFAILWKTFAPVKDLKPLKFARMMIRKSVSPRNY